MAGRRRTRRVWRTQQEWSALLSEQVDSGLSQRAFCEARGVSVSSFANAKRRTGAMRPNGPTPSVSEFIAVNLDNTVPMTTGGSWDIELALAAGVVLRIRSV